MTQIGGAAAGTATNRGPRTRPPVRRPVAHRRRTRITGLVEQLEYKAEDTVAGNVNGYSAGRLGDRRAALWREAWRWFSYGRADDGSAPWGGARATPMRLGRTWRTLGGVYRFLRVRVLRPAYRLREQRRTANTRLARPWPRAHLSLPVRDAKGSAGHIPHVLKTREVSKKPGISSPFFLFRGTTQPRPSSPHRVALEDAGHDLGLKPASSKSFILDPAVISG